MAEVNIKFIEKIVLPLDMYCIMRSLKALPHENHCLEEFEIEDCWHLGLSQLIDSGMLSRHSKFTIGKELINFSFMYIAIEDNGTEHLRISKWSIFTILLRFAQNKSTSFFCLVELYIGHWDTLEFFPDGCLPPHNLRSLSI